MTAGQVLDTSDGAITEDAGTRPARSRTRGGVLGRLGSLPALLLYLLGFVSPIVFLGYESTQSFSTLRGIYGGGSLANYKDVFTDATTLQALMRTVVISAVTVLVSAIIGLIISFASIYLPPVVRSIALFCIIAPMLVNGVVRIFGWSLLLTKGGLVDQVTGVTLLGSDTANLIGLVNLFIGYMVLSLMPVVGAVTKDRIIAAGLLGASELTIFRRVVFPLCLPGLLSGSVIVFGASSGAVLGPYLLGGSTYGVITVDIYRKFLVLANPTAGAPLAIVLLVLVALVTIVCERLVRRRFLAWQS